MRERFRGGGQPTSRSSVTWSIVVAVVAACHAGSSPPAGAPETSAVVAPVTAGELAVALAPGFDEAEWVRRAEEVVIASVERVESRYVTNAYGDRIIVSTASLRPERVLKGRLAAGEPLVVEFPGGTVDDVTLHVSHAPSFEPGEQAVIFVARGPTRRTVLGGGRGKLRVDRGKMPGLGTDLANFERRVSALVAEEGGVR